MLGKRSKSHYGDMTLDEINKFIKKSFPKVKFNFKQSNYEGKIIEYIQKSNNYDAIIINAGAYTHTSIAIRDALEIIQIPIISVHLSNIHEREEFRKVDFLKDVVDKVIMGRKEDSYIDAITYLLANT